MEAELHRMDDHDLDEWINRLGTMIDKTYDLTDDLTAELRRAKRVRRQRRRRRG